MRRAWRIGAWTLGALLMVIVTLSALVLLAGNTVRGRVWIERATAHLSDGHIRLSGLSGSFPGAIDLEQLQLADDRGVWLNAERISLRWSPLALLARHLKVERLQLARLAIERRPVSDATCVVPTMDSLARTPVSSGPSSRMSIDSCPISMWGSPVRLPA